MPAARRLLSWRSAWLPRPVEQTGLSGCLDYEQTCLYSQAAMAKAAATTLDGLVRERATRGGSLRARSTPDGSVRERQPRDGSARDGSARDGSARDGSARDRLLAAANDLFYAEGI